MTSCPAETTLSDLLAGVLPPGQRVGVLAHVEGCTDCQRVLAAAGSDASVGDVPPGPAAAPLERGATLSRYVVLERIGAGAMGVVYAAYDPELDRQVALKVLRPEGRQVEELRLRLVLEAQSLARLDESLRLLQDAVDRFQRSAGPDAVRSATPLASRAELFIRLGRYAEALRDALRALAVQQKAHGADSPNAAMPLLLLAEVALATGAPRESLALCQKGRELYESAEGPEGMNVARHLTCLAEAHLALGEPQKALPLVEPARKRLGSSSFERWDTGRATFVSARVLLALKPPERTRAATLAEEARTRFESLGVRARKDMERVQAWQRHEGLR